MGALAAAAVAKANARKGIVTPTVQPSSSKRTSIKKEPIVTHADPSSRRAAKNAAAAALASRLGGRGSGPPATSPPAGSIATTTTRINPQSGLSPADERIATEYRKMKKLGIHEGAIRQKMNSEGVSQHIIESVMASTSALSSSPSRNPGAAAPPPNKQQQTRQTVKGPKLNPNEEKIATKYRKMMKLGLPEGAVRHKMNADGVSEKIQLSVVGGGSGGSGAPATAASSSAHPSSAVPLAPVPAPTQRMSLKKAPKRISSLSPQEEKIATPYRKMINLGLPEGAVRHKMNADGIVSSKIIESVIAGELPPPPSSVKAQDGPTPLAMLKPVPVNKDTRRPANSGGTSKPQPQSSRVRKKKISPPRRYSATTQQDPLAESQRTVKVSNNTRNPKVGSSQSSSAITKIDSARKPKMIARPTVESITTGQPAATGSAATSTSPINQSRLRKTKSTTSKPVVSGSVATSTSPINQSRLRKAKSKPPTVAPTPPPPFDNTPSLDAARTSHRSAHPVSEQAPTKRRQRKKQTADYIDEANPLAVVLSPRTKSKRNKKQPILLENGSNPTIGAVGRRKTKKRDKESTTISKPNSGTWKDDDSDDGDNSYDSFLEEFQQKNNGNKKKKRAIVALDHDADCYCIVM